MDWETKSTQETKKQKGMFNKFWNVIIWACSFQKTKQDARQKMKKTENSEGNKNKMREKERDREREREREKERERMCEKGEWKIGRNDGRRWYMGRIVPFQEGEQIFLVFQKETKTENKKGLGPSELALRATSPDKEKQEKLITKTFSVISQEFRCLSFFVPIFLRFGHPKNATPKSPKPLQK